MKKNDILEDGEKIQEEDGKIGYDNRDHITNNSAIVEKLYKRKNYFNQMAPYSTYLFALTTIFLLVSIFTEKGDKSVIFVFGIVFAISFYVMIFIKIRLYEIGEKINNLG